MATVECEHVRVGGEYLESVSWPSALRQSAHDRCYCHQCYSSTEPNTVTLAGYTYVIPRGWTRFAVPIDEAIAQHHDVWDQWIQCYHGTKIENAKSAVEHRQLLLPSDVTSTGQTVEIRQGHTPGEHHVFTTPSISYASLNCYAHTYEFISPHDARLYKIKVVLQCKQKPSSIIVQPETVGARKKQISICPFIPNEQLEWKTQHRSAIMIYGLLLQIKTPSKEDDNDSDKFRSQSTDSTESIVTEPMPIPRQPPPPRFKPKVDVVISPVVPFPAPEYVPDRPPKRKKTILKLILLFLLTILPLAALIIGAMFSSDCPIQPWIPRWLIVFGAVGLATFGIIFLINLVAFICCSNESQVGKYISGCVLCLMAFFFLAWLIAGSVWVFPYKMTVQFSQPNAVNYCRETPYMFAFGLLLTQYVLVAFVGCIGAVCVLCVVCSS